MIAQVKENQKTLLRDCERTAERAAPVGTHVSRNKGRNRKERRTVRVFNTLRWFEKKTRAAWGRYIAAVIQVKRVRREFDAKRKAWTVSKEEAYYVATTFLTAKEAAAAIRRHWWIENKNHYVRDVSLGEDKSRIRVNPDRFVKLRSIALNIMRLNKVKNVGHEWYENVLSLEKVLTYHHLFCFRV